MKLSKEDVALLRSLVEWRRANGWTYKVAWDKPSFDRDGAPMSDPLRRHTWESPELPNGERAYVEAMVIEGELWAVNYAPDYGDTTLAHLPGTAFMDMARVIFAAGRESAYTTDEWRAVFDAVDGPRAWHEPVNDRAIADSVLANCRKFYTDAYLQHRRAGGTDWEKVADANS